jgi:hypothetical protein
MWMRMVGDWCDIAGSLTLRRAAREVTACGTGMVGYGCWAGWRGHEKDVRLTMWSMNRMVGRIGVMSCRWLPKKLGSRRRRQCNALTSFTFISS